MYFYEIRVYHSLLGSEEIIMGHDDRLDNHQLNVIVQEAFDECIEKYCNKPLLEKGEEACRMEVETIFKEYLPLQLKNHGFKSIKINATCSILDGALFIDDGGINHVLHDRYKDKILPPCRKCIRKGGDGCIVPNIVKYLLRCYIKPFSVPFDENEEEHNTGDDFNISVLKQYFTNSNKSVEDSKIAAAALENICDNNNFEYYYTENDGFKPVKGNEIEIIKALMSGSYYVRWDCITDYSKYDDMTFRMLSYSHREEEFNNNLQTYFKIVSKGRILIDLRDEL